MRNVKDFQSYKIPTTGGSRPATVEENKQRHRAQDMEVIWKFLMQKDVPSWYRGISTFQMVAAKSLSNAIRDDTQQDTSHRVRYCLSIMGLDLLVNDKQTKFLMRLSRGNDLAFLWFLMEVHYKTPGPNYSVNEQLIMSSIAYLDTLTTLRELDRVLPPGHPSLKEMERKRSKLCEPKHVKIRCTPSKEKNTLPYLQKLVRRREYGKPLTIGMPDYKIKLGKYHEGIRSNFALPNETNRWYANYELQPEKRIVNGIIREEIGNIFKDCTESPLNTDEITNLCEHHKVIGELEKSLAHQLKVIARDKCLQYMDVNKKRKEASHKRVVDQLERDTQLYLCKFREFAEKSRRHNVVSVITDTGCCQYLVDDETEAKEPCRQESKNDCICDKDVEQNAQGKLSDISSIDSLNNKSKYNTASHNSMKTRCDAGDSIDLNHRSNVNVKQSTICNKKQQYLTGYDYGHMESSTPTPSQKFFAAPVEHKPYQFDYCKIFRLQDHTSTNEEDLKIRQAFIKAIDSSQVFEKCINSAPPNLDKAVKNCVQKIWKTKVAHKNLELAAEEAKEKETRWIFKKDFYDCEDKKLMDHMLKTALEHMSKNPKYVLASMPEAYKITILREWVYQRYGKRYTNSERAKLFQQSLRIFNALDQITLSVRMPTARELGTEPFVNYSCRDYVIEKSKYIRKQYYKRLDTAIMDQARVFWFAMRPYLCSNGPPRNTYFAYMPSRVMDLTRFRLWKPSEFKDAKNEWIRRNCRSKSMSL